MVKISYENSELLQNIIKDEKNKKIVIELLEIIIKKEIEDIEYKKVEKFQTISEYDFSLIKVIGKFKNEEKNEIYLRLIKGGKIKETVFCYWSLIYEEYIKKIAEPKKIPKKVTIAEKGNEEKYQNKIFLSLEQEAKNEYNLEINFIEIWKFINEHKNKKNELEKWCEFIDETKESILFVGLKNIIC